MKRIELRTVVNPTRKLEQPTDNIMQHTTDAVQDQTAVSNTSSADAVLDERGKVQGVARHFNTETKRESNRSENPFDTTLIVIYLLQMLYSICVSDTFLSNFIPLMMLFHMMWLILFRN